MRAAASLLLIAIMSATGFAARADEPVDSHSKDPLFKAVFAQKPPSPSATTILARPGSLLASDFHADSLRYDDGWAGAVQLSPGGNDPNGPPVGAGATVRLGTDLQDKVMTGLGKLGMRTVSSGSLRNQGRWYLFAAASGRAVGLNVGRDGQGAFQRLGWSAEGTSTLISDAQAGVAWRKGDTQASLGYVHREIQSDFNGVSDPGHLSDSMVAFSLSIRSH